MVDSKITSQSERFKGPMEKIDASEGIYIDANIKPVDIAIAGSNALFLLMDMELHSKA